MDDSTAVERAPRPLAPEGPDPAREGEAFGAWIERVAGEMLKLSVDTRRGGADDSE